MKQLPQCMGYYDRLGHCSSDDVDDSMWLVEEDIQYDVVEVGTGDWYREQDVPQLGDAVVAVVDIHSRKDDTIHTAVVATMVAGVDNDVMMLVVNQPRCKSCYDDAFH